jgi:nucleoside-diphosphate-sugar epimerase
MNIAIFGATSQVATDLIINLAQNGSYVLTLFSREPSSLEHRMSPFCSKATAHYLSYCDFDNGMDFDVIVNFVGVGDPARAKDIGHKIISITAEYDDKALAYIKVNPKCKYVFLSSGAVYGSDFTKPADQDTKAVFNINHLDSTDWYSIAKFCTEAKHRTMSDFSIVDVRIFNYFSATQNFESKFLMSDIVQSIIKNKVLLTGPENITRDFITPLDFFQLFEKIITKEPCNLAVDAYTREPIHKITLLTELKSRYGLMFEFTEGRKGINATGFKSNYYSLNRRAERFGYVPRFTSLDGVVAELDELLDRVSG